MNPIAQFSKIVDHLNNPYALVGLLVCVALAILEMLFRRNFFPKLTQRQAPSILRFVISHGFRLAVLIVIVVFGYASYQVHEQNRSTGTPPGLIQKTGNCGANVDGNQNQTNLECNERDKTK